MKTDAEILAESREYIEEHGWGQGEFLLDNGSVCGLGGITVSQGWYDVNDGELNPEYVNDMIRIARKLLVALDMHRGLSREEIPTRFAEWNDNEYRVGQDVVDAFMKAEKIERSGDVEE